MKAKDLKPGMKFQHHSSLKIPNPIEVDWVYVFKRRVRIMPKNFSDYSFTFDKEENVEVIL